MSGDAKPELRMSAYYYSFEPTGVPEIDRILSAVAWAGKAYHHTERWSDFSEYNQPPPDGFEGRTCVDWIQNAANDAARAMREAASSAPPLGGVAVKDIPENVRRAVWSEAVSTVKRGAQVVPFLVRVREDPDGIYRINEVFEGIEGDLFVQRVRAKRLVRSSFLEVVLEEEKG